MKCPYVLNIYLPQFLSYMYYSCHTNRITYEQIIWITLYVKLMKVQNVNKITKNQTYPNRKMEFITFFAVTWSDIEWNRQPKVSSRIVTAFLHVLGTRKTLRKTNSKYQYLEVRNFIHYLSMM